MTKSIRNKLLGSVSTISQARSHASNDNFLWHMYLGQLFHKLLERFNMKDYSPSIAPIMKGDKLVLNQCSKNDFKREHMKNIPYALAVGSLIYAQICTRPDIAYTVGVLGR